MTNAEIVSRIINDINSVNKDSHVSKRWILSILKSKARSYIAQKWADGTLFGEESLYTHINCVEMIKVNTIDCCIAEFRVCNTLMRSRHRIQGVVFSRMGPAILAVTNADRSIFFKKIQPRSYQIERKQKYAKVLPFVYYFYDGYIWIPDTHIELINVDVITLEKKKALKISACKEDDTIDCISTWDYDFVCPEKLLEYIIAETLQEVSLKIQIPTDENPDMDSNIKSAKIE